MKKIKLFVLAAMNLDPKLIVTVLLRGLTKALYYQRVRSISQSAIDNTALVPDLAPDPDAFKLEVDKLETLNTKAKNLKAQTKANTKATATQEKKITNILVSKWAGIIQNTAGITAETIKLLGFGIKNVDDQQGEPEYTVSNSFPKIMEIDNSHHLEHIISILNDKTGLIALPKGAKRIDLYEYIGADEPKDITKMQYLGSPTRGKFTNHFTVDQVGLTVWYMVVYVPKKAKTSVELTGAVKSNVQ